MTQAPDWGGILRRVRRTHRLSQRQLAERAGVSKTSIARLEAGACTRVDTQALAAILSSVGCRIVVLTEEDEEVVPFDPDGAARDVVGKRFPAHVRVFRWMAPTGDGVNVRFQFARKECDLLGVDEVDDRLIPLPDGKVRTLYRDGRYGPAGRITKERRRSRTDRSDRP